MGVKSNAVKACDTAFSIYIRKSHEDKFAHVACVTCGMTYDWKSITNGHFMPRGNMNTRWDYQNCAPQCVECQGRNNGERDLFAKYLDNKYGAGTAEAVRLRSIQVKQFHIDEIKALTKEFRSQTV